MVETNSLCSIARTICAVGLLAFQPWTRSNASSSLQRVQLFVLVIGLVLVVVGYGPVIRNRQWQAKAVAVTGRVVDHVRTAPVVEFDIGGSHVRFLGPEVAESLIPLGSAVAVLFDPSEPDDARLAGAVTRPSRWLAIGIGVVVVGVVLTWL